MEILTVLVTAAKSMNFSMTKPPETFLNVNMKDYFYTHYLILTGKSIVAGYASVFFVPLWITLATFFASMVRVYLKDLDNALFHMASKGVVATVQYWNPKGEFVAIPAWIFVQWDTSFQLFLDIYLVITIILFFIKFFGKEYEKAFTMICIMLCLDWCIDRYQGISPLNIPDMIVTFMFLGFSLLTLRPSRINSNLSYVYICALFLVWMSYKYFKVFVEHGFSDSSRNWKEMLSTIEIYVYDALKYFNLYAPTVKYKSMVVKEFVKHPYIITTIEMDSNGSASPSLLQLKA